MNPLRKPQAHLLQRVAASGPAYKRDAKATRAPARRRLLATPLALAVALATLVLAPAIAHAETTHEFLKQITEIPATGPHGEAVALPGPLSGVNAMIADSGQLWVAEDKEGVGSTRVGGSRVDAFNGSSGAFESQLPQDPPLDNTDQGIALGHETGERELYVGARGAAEAAVVEVYGPLGTVQAVWTGANTPDHSFSASGGAEHAEVAGVAVDNSGRLEDWAAGDVYVSASSATAGVIDVFEPVAGGAEPTKVVGQIKGPETPCVFGQVACVSPLTRAPCAEAETECVLLFVSPTEVSIDPVTGDVFVMDALPKVVDVFEPVEPLPGVKGTFKFQYQITGTPSGRFVNELSGIAAGDQGVYVRESQNPGDILYQFNADGKYEGSLTGAPGRPFTRIRGIAVDPNGDVYVGEYNQDANTGLIDEFGPGLAIPDVVTKVASEVKPLSATLNGTVDPDGEPVTSCEFEYGTSASYGQTAPCVPVAASIPMDSSEHPVSAEVKGLLSGTTYHFRLRAADKNDTDNPSAGSDETLTTRGPGIESASTSDVASTSATFDAAINPDGAPTSYYFEYGKTGTYGHQTPVAPGQAIGSGASEVAVPAQHVQGLEASTLYHYRVLAVSEVEPGEPAETFAGPDQTFTTQGAGSFALPDSRAWEMVSPPDKHGALIRAISTERATGVIEAAAKGGAITYLTDAPTESDPAGYSNYVQVLSSRGASGWSTQDIANPHDGETGVSIGFNGEEYRFFSEDLSSAVVQPFGSFIPQLSSEATEQTPYLRHDVTNTYTPLVTAANVPAGVAFGEEGECPSGKNGNARILCGPLFEGASPDGSHVVLNSKFPLTSRPTPGGELYEWTAGKLALVTVLPGGAVSPTGGSLGLDAGRHAISSDGSRVVWTNRHLYMWNRATESSVQLDEIQPGVQGGEPEAPGAAEFQAAASDDSRVFFMDRQQLTPGAKREDRNLYECAMVVVAGALHCDLSNLTPTADEEAAGVEGVLGTSEDGSSVYFVANGVLQNSGVPVSGAVHGTCAGLFAPVEARCNLYVSHDGVIKLVAVLNGHDNPDWGHQQAEALDTLTARVSPNGEWLAFMSEEPLTGYDNSDAVSNVPDEEVFLYQADTGKLVCASCNPTGARPLGVQYDQLEGGTGGLVGGDAEWGAPVSAEWLAANIPGWVAFRPNFGVHQPRYLSDSGRLFFNSHDTLVPADQNENEDVYEFEPANVGGCRSSTSSGSVVYVREVAHSPVDGCIGLISSGSSSEESAFLDATETGSEVFFLTTSKLVPQDVDDSLDVYDARECTSASPCFSAPVEQPPACTTEASCKHAPSPQPAIFGLPASATFSGPGNVAPSTPAAPKRVTKKTVRCKRGVAKSKRGKCVKKPKKRAKHAKKLNRRAR